jgi:hypothetical protein
MATNPPSTHSYGVRYSFMRTIKYGLFAAAVTGFFLLIPATPSHAQITVTFGAEPNCPYGYYDYAPYNCSPDGYYGPAWFNNGAFVGTGHWYHGSSNFHGEVNNTYDPQHGYKGTMPPRGEKPSHMGAPQNFKGNESRDGQGHNTPQEHNAPHN